jgi:hypothetical protein
MAIKINFVLFERTFKVIYEDPLQLFRNILTKNSEQSAILVLYLCGTKFLRKVS